MLLASALLGAWMSCPQGPDADHMVLHHFKEGQHHEAHLQLKNKCSDATPVPVAAYVSRWSVVDQGGVLFERLLNESLVLFDLEMAKKRGVAEVCDLSNWIDTTRACTLSLDGFSEFNQLREEKPERRLPWRVQGKALHIPRFGVLTPQAFGPKDTP